MPYVRANNIQLYYQEAGVGAPVINIHGGFAGLDTVLRDNEWDWERTYPDFFRFITYDRRGCGRSASPDEGYDLVTQARDLAGLMDALQIESAHLIGSSAGGPIAWYFAALYPARTRSLVLVGTALDMFPLGEPGSDLVREQIMLLEREGPEAAFDARPTGIEYTFNELWDEPEAIARGKLDLYRSRVASYRALAAQVPRETRVHYYATELRSMQAYMTSEIRAYAKAVQAPTYIMQGDKDQMATLKDAQDLARTIRGAQVEIFKNGPHSLLAQDVHARDRLGAWVTRIEKQRNKH